MMVATVPIIAPLMVQAGYDPVWYGIIIVLLIELAMISPPFGINLFVIQGMRRRGKLTDVIKGASPFVIACDHDRNDLHLAGDRDVGAADVRVASAGVQGACARIPAWRIRFASVRPIQQKFLTHVAQTTRSRVSRLINSIASSPAER